MIGKTCEADYDFEDGIASRMVEYVQAVVVSTPPTEPRQVLDEEGWNLLREEVKGLYGSLLLPFFLANSAKRKATEPGFDSEYDTFSVQAQMHVTFVRALRYPSHDIEFLKDFLDPHDEVLQRLFGISSADFVEAINRNHLSLSRDCAAAFVELHEEHQKALRLAAEISGSTSDGGDMIAAMARLRKDAGWQKRMESITGRLMGLDLFDLQRITRLPVRLLEELSLEPGQDQVFFVPGDYAGWPLRVLPTKFRPFLILQRRLVMIHLAHRTSTD